MVLVEVPSLAVADSVDLSGVILAELEHPVKAPLVEAQVLDLNVLELLDWNFLAVAPEVLDERILQSVGQVIVHWVEEEVQVVGPVDVHEASTLVKNCGCCVQLCSLYTPHCTFTVLLIKFEDGDE